MRKTTRRTVLVVGGSALGVSFAGCLNSSVDSTEAARFRAATVYLDPGCACCGDHADYLDSANAEIEIVERSTDELSDLKDAISIPPEYRSCHTTKLDSGYIIEGHVPVGVINELVNRSPPVKVVTLPGMPSGSPGMPGSKNDEWVFYAIDDTGEIEEFWRI